MKNPGCSIVFTKELAGKKNFRQPVFLAPVKYDLANAAQPKANGSYKFNCRKVASSLGNAEGNGMGNVKYVSKEFKCLLFFEENWPKKPWQKYHSTPLN